MELQAAIRDAHSLSVVRGCSAGPDCKPGRGSVGPPASGASGFAFCCKRPTTLERQQHSSLSAARGLRHAACAALAASKTSSLASKRAARRGPGSPQPPATTASPSAAAAGGPQRVNAGGRRRESSRAVRKHANLNHVAALHCDILLPSSPPHCCRLELPHGVVVVLQHTQWPSWRSTSASSRSTSTP